jgi:hypothetical protein
MMRHAGALALSTLLIALLATEASADNWNVYIPPPPASSSPPPFAMTTWVLVETVSDDDALFGDPCSEAAMSLHYQYWNSGDRDTSMRALHAVCVDQKTGAVVDSTKSP